MSAYVALLRAVNVGGTGKLAMTDLKAICEAAGFGGVRTYIASGNVVFASAESEEAVKHALETRLRMHMGKPLGVLVRSAAEMNAVVAENPFPEAPGNRTVAIFIEGARSPDWLNGIVNQSEDEEVRLGRREIYVRYGAGMGQSKLRIPAARLGTARNMNTVAKLADMASKLVGG